MAKNMLSKTSYHILTAIFALDRQRIRRPKSSVKVLETQGKREEVQKEDCRIKWMKILMH
jgi:hypothetical protein